MEAGREFQLLEVIGTNVLANEVVRHFSNLTAEECWESAEECWESAKPVLRAKHALGGIIDFNLTLTFRSTCRGSIYSKGKVQKHFFGEPASQGSRREQNRQLV